MPKINRLHANSLKFVVGRKFSGGTTSSRPARGPWSGRDFFMDIELFMRVIDALLNKQLRIQCNDNNNRVGWHRTSLQQRKKYINIFSNRRMKRRTMKNGFQLNCKITQTLEWKWKYGEKNNSTTHKISFHLRYS